jgi:hypothetical protein
METSRVKITQVSVYRTDLPYVGGSYAWGAGNVIETGRSAAGSWSFSTRAPSARIGG